MPKVIHNLERPKVTRYKAGYQHEPKPQLSIVFVAMKRNIADLPDVLKLGVRLNVKRFSISNVIPHTDEMCGELLEHGSVHNHDTLKATSNPIINLPPINTNSLTQFPLAGKGMNRAIDSCQFIEQGSTAIRWDGSVSPCPPLLHTYDSYFAELSRRNHAFSLGHVNETGLLEIWDSPNYAALREHIQTYDFSACITYNGCDVPEENIQDCLASPTPTYGGCLWGQGLIQCP